jgi:hypothetical protein
MAHSQALTIGRERMLREALYRYCNRKEQPRIRWIYAVAEHVGPKG